MAPTVLVNERPLGQGVVLGHITLNAEATLNSLSLEMIDLIQAALDRWRSRADIIAIFFDAAGSKAFSAGGDIQNLYHDMQATPGGPCIYCEAFFRARISIGFRSPSISQTHPRLGPRYRYGRWARHLFGVSIPDCDRENPNGDAGGHHRLISRCGGYVYL